MKPIWFKKWGWIFRPAGFIGWVLSLGALSVVVWVFIVIDRTSHSVSATLIGVFVWAWIIAVTLGWVAKNTS